MKLLILFQTYYFGYFLFKLQFTFKNNQLIVDYSEEISLVFTIFLRQT